MRVEKVYTDTAWHPERRRVKYFPVTKTKDASGQQVVIDNTDWVGDFPILWSRKVGDMRLLVMLINEKTGETVHGEIHEADFLKLPETDIDW